jgi:hypothetical protein
MNNNKQIGTLYKIKSTRCPLRPWVFFEHYEDHKNGAWKNANWSYDENSLLIYIGDALPANQALYCTVIDQQGRTVVICRDVLEKLS